MLSCTCRYFTLFSRSFPSRGPDFNLFHAAQVSTPLTPCLHFSLSPTCTADTHPVRRQGCAAAPTSATRTGTRPLPCRRGRGRAHARRGSVYLPAPAARSPLAPLCSLTRSLALLSTWPFMRRSRNECARSEGRRGRQQREKLLLCCWQQSDLGRSSTRTATTNERLFVRRLSCLSISLGARATRRTADRTSVWTTSTTWTSLE